MYVENPCLTCGACCAHFRVSFFWAEADPQQGGRVPAELTEDLPPFRVCMRGTNQPNPRCIALIGTLGEHVSCTIYPNVSSTCTEFGVHWQSGRLFATPDELEHCNQTRAAFNLPPLPAITVTLLPEADPAALGSF